MYRVVDETTYGSAVAGLAVLGLGVLVAGLAVGDLNNELAFESSYLQILTEKWNWKGKERQGKERTVPPPPAETMVRPVKIREVRRVSFMVEVGFEVFFRFELIELKWMEVRNRQREGQV